MNPRASRPSSLLFLSSLARYFLFAEMSLEMLIRQLIAGLQDASDEGLEKPNV